MNIIQLIIVIAIALAVGAGIGYFTKQYQTHRQQEKLSEQVDRVLTDVTKKAQETELQAKDKALKIRQNAEQEVNRRRREFGREEDRLQKRRNALDVRTERLENREHKLNKQQSSVDRRSNEIKKLHTRQVAKLEQVSRMTTHEAREQLLEEAEKDARNDIARIIRQVEAEAKEEGNRRARELIALAIQRVASDHVTEITTSVVPLPADDMKGRIIGRNGRNIRAFELSAGVDVIVDDTPEVITISCFDPVRREVARRSMARLILDGRIHPAHIEKILGQEKDEIDRVVADAGKQAAYDAGVSGLSIGITKVLGRLKFRTSYGQNQLNHAVETAHLAVMIAAELGADMEISKAGGLLHDLGKAIDHNVEGTHAAIGADLAKRHNLHPKVVNAIASHHHEEEQECVEAVIVEAADAISGARPGARRESLDQYIKRIRALEEIANSFKGVKESFALQAGREVRIIVKPKAIDDLGAARIARDIAKNIEETMQYPGQIKVTVIRETRSVDFAK